MLFIAYPPQTISKALHLDFATNRSIPLSADSIREQRQEVRLKEEELIISLRGQDRYVIMGLETYQRLREYELAVAA